MKYIQKIVLMMAVAVLGISSCTQEELANQGGEPTDEAMLTITAYGVNTRASTEPPTAAEREYTTLDIYYFDVSAGNDRLIEHTKVTTAGSYPFNVKIPRSVISSHSTKIYVIASPVLVGGATLPDAPASSSGIDQLNLTGMVDGGKLAYISDARKIPMSGSQTMSGGIQGGVNVKVEMQRSVAKLRVNVVDNIATASGIIVKEKMMTIGFYNLRTGSGMMSYRDAGTLFKSQTFGAADAVTADPTVEPFRSDAGTSNVHTHYVYINEHVFDPAKELPGNRTKINISLPYVKGGELKDRNIYSVPLDFPIYRNHIYDVTLSVIGPADDGFEVDVEVTIKIIPWLGVVDTDPIE